MQRRVIYRRPLLGCVVALMLLAAACTVSEGESSTDIDSSEAGHTDAETPVTNDGETEAGGRDTLEVALEFLPANLIPHENQGFGHLLEVMTIPLLQTDENNEIFSNMLESWDVSDDAKTVTLTLKEDLVWSDGAPVTSGDVVMSLTQYLDPSISVWATRIVGIVGQDAYANGEAESIAGLTSADDRTVVIELAESDAAWLPLFGYLSKFMPILPQHILGDVPHDALLANEYFQEWPVVTGPYRLVEFAQDQYLEFERNPEWSGGEAGFARLFMKLVQPDVQVAQLQTGDVQMMPNVQPPDVERVESISGVEVQTVTGAAPNAWWFVANYEPIEDPRVRQAMVFAVDRQGICDQVLLGLCSVPQNNVRQIAPDWAIPADDMIEYRYDPDRARELLEEADWDPNTELIFHNVDPGQVAQTVIDIAQANMAEVGINWIVENSTDVAGTFDAMAEQSVHGRWGGGGNFVIDPSQTEAYSDCDAFWPNGANTTHYCDPELDALYAAARSEGDETERAGLYKDAYRRLNENPMEVVLFVQDKIVAHDARLKGVKPSPTGDQFWNIGEWHWEE